MKKKENTINNLKKENNELIEKLYKELKII